MSVPADARLSADRARWSEVKQLFWAATAAPPENRAALIDASTNDVTMRDQVRRLLDAAEQMGDRFERPAPAALRHAGHTVGGDAPTLVGRRIGRYEIRHRVGQGGMGAVYEAVQVDGAFERRVALKTLWRGADSDVLVRRFRSERQILASLEHPNIARLIDGGATDEGMPYLVMEFVDGVPIDVYCNAQHLGVHARLELFRQVCAAVQDAHRCLVIHRDIKPSNVLVTADGTVKLLDFGIAKLIDDPRDEGTLTGAGLSAFSTAYAAPEQIAGQPVSTATDVYALGALLTTLLAGRPPFVERASTEEAAGGRSLRELIRDELAPAPSTLLSGAAARALRGDLDAIVLAALRKDPSRRYATVDALSEDVHRHLRGERIFARPDTLAYRVQTFVRRRRALVASGVLVATALVAISAVALWQARANQLEAQRSERIAGFLTRMIGATNADMGNPFLRTGTHATVAQMLDSALARVATDFPDDARIRARLYTTIGMSDIAQSRVHEASGVLDSAVALARMGYGVRSDAFAEASVAASGAAFHRSPVGVADAFARDALAALAGREGEQPELYARALGALAAARFVAADFRASDSLAREAIDRERRRTRAPTMSRAWAIDILGRAEAVRGHLAAADTLLAHTIAITDSLGADFSMERIDALQARSQVKVGLGQWAEVERLVGLGLSAARRGYGPSSRETALFLAGAVPIARRAQDDRGAAAMRDTALHIIDSIPDVSSYVQLAVLSAAITDLESQREFARADSLAARLMERVRAQGSPLSIVYAAVMAGDAKFYAGRLDDAERIFRDALVLSDSLEALQRFVDPLRASLATTAARQGRKSAADSIIVLLPPAVAAQTRTTIAAYLAHRR